MSDSDVRGVNRFTEAATALRQSGPHQRIDRPF
jgi:hypothetical protein